MHFWAIWKLVPKAKALYAWQQFGSLDGLYEAECPKIWDAMNGIY
jgi:hypothetical protein